MNETVRTIIEHIPAASKLELEGRVVIGRQRVTPRQIAEARRSGRFELSPPQSTLYELEVGGAVVARGKIVRRRGERYFRVLEIVEQAQGGNHER